MINFILLLPFMILNAIGFVLCILVDLFVKPFIYGATFLYNFMKAVLK